MFFFNQPTVHHRLAKQNSRRKRSGQKKYSSLDNAPTASVTQRTICWISILDMYILFIIARFIELISIADQNFQTAVLSSRISNQILS